MDAIDRRTLISGTVAAAVFPLTAIATTVPSGKQAPAYYRYKVGSFEVTAVNDGTWFREIDEKFVRNAPFGDVQKALSDSFQPPSQIPTPFTPLVINTGKKLVLIDTGTGRQYMHMAPQSGTFHANLAAAGINPKSIDTILISHFHADHINGLKTKDGAKVFPNAEIMVSSAEWTYWMDDTRLNNATDTTRPYFLNTRRIFADIAKDVKRFEPGGEPTPGITSIAAYGHTPGHTAFAVASGNQSLLVLSDTTNNPWLFVRHPEWQPVIDVDGPMAVETRKRMLDLAAADRMLVQGYHFPFPACGYITRTASGYDLMPVSWQPAL